MRKIYALLLAMLLIAGCSHIGPGTITRDRADYTTTVAESWKRGMLLNIVKIRYGDAPIFLDVASIINQYSLEGELNASLGWQFPTAGANNQRVGAVGRYYDRPTITYNLLTGEKFARSLMTPIAPGCAKPIPTSTLCWRSCAITRIPAQWPCGSGRWRGAIPCS